MAAPITWLDLRDLPEREQPIALIAQIEDLAPGAVLGLRAAESPDLLLQRVNVRLREALAWEIERSDAGWVARVRRAEDRPARDVLDLLRRDHKRLDTLLGQALRQLNAGDLAGAAPRLRTFARGLRRHLHAEDEILVHALAGGASEHLESMLREHRELHEQLAAVEDGLRAGPDAASPEAWEVEPFVALLTGALAEHEQREESSVFPLWTARHAALAPEAAEALLVQVRDVLYAD
jgi:hemerythrin superfamily protein